MSHQLTVLIVGTLPPPIGGTTVSLQQLVTALGQRDDVQVIVVNTGGVRGNSIKGLLRFTTIILKVFVAGARADAISLHTVPTGLPFVGPIAWTAARLWHKPLIIRMLGRNCFAVTGKRGAIDRWFIRHCDLYLSETKSATEAARRGGVTHAAWYGTGRPMKALQSPSSNSRPCRRLVFVSQIKLSKGVGTLVDAADRIDQDVQIDVYGPFTGDVTEEFFRSRKHVKYRGVIPPDQIDQVLSQYDALVFPTHWPGEGYPGVIMEAFAAGLPVITTRWMSIPEIVDESCGILVEPQNPAALAAAITRLMQDAALYGRLCVGARARRDMFDATHWVDRFVELCRGFIDRA